MKILKNIKYNGNPYKIGEDIEINKEDMDLFIEKGIIDNNEIIEQPISEVRETTNTIAYQDMTKTGIGKELDKKGIEYNSRDSKDKLIELLLGSE